MNAIFHEGILPNRLGLSATKRKDEFEVILSGRNKKMNMYSGKFAGCSVVPMDVTNIESVRAVVVSTKPDITIYSTPTKFVDLAEKQPMECIGLL